MVEFSEFLAAVRRYWPTWLGITAVAVLVAGLVLTLTPATYQASAQVFVTASPTIANSASFVEERVKSYPGVASSASVLAPVIDQLHLAESPQSLAEHISTTVPANTSLIDLLVTDRDPARAAQIANAVAQQLITQVQTLEMRASGERLLALTVSNPATTPTRPVSPVAVDILGLGAVVGLFLGLAAAVARSRRDTAVRTAVDVRRAWGPGPQPQVLAPRRGRRARGSALLGGPVRELARKLEFSAADCRRNVLVLPALPGQQSIVRAMADDVATMLRSRGLAVSIGTEVDTAASPEQPGVHLTLADPLAPPQFWQQASGACDSAVLVVPCGAVDRAELREVRDLLEVGGMRTPTVVVLPRRAARRLRGEPRPGQAAPAAEEDAVSAAERPERSTVAAAGAGR